MKNGIWVFMGLMLLSLFAYAQGPMPNVDPQVAGEGLVLGISTSAWILIAAGVGLIAVWLLRLLLLPNLTGKALGWASSILIFIATFGVTIMNAPDKWMEALLAAVSAFMVAAKAWDILTSTKVGKKVMKDPITNKR